MCYVQVAYAAAAVIGGYLASKAAAPKAQAAPAPPAAATPPAPTQVTPPAPVNRAPTPVQRTQQPLQAARAANTPAATGRNASSASTMLTGPSGVDLSGASIGRNTLLGM